MEMVRVYLGTDEVKSESKMLMEMYRASQAEEEVIEEKIYLFNKIFRYSVAAIVFFSIVMIAMIFLQGEFIWGLMFIGGPSSLLSYVQLQVSNSELEEKKNTTRKLLKAMLKEQKNRKKENM